MEESDSDSIVESAEIIKCDETPELPDIVMERPDSKASKFRGFYLTQKTIVADSNQSSIDCDKLASSFEAEKDGKTTETNLENVNEANEEEVEFERDKQKHYENSSCLAPSNFSMENEIQVLDNTTDEDISDKDSIDSVVQNSIKDMKLSEEKQDNLDGNETDNSEILVSDMDYYKIRYETTHLNEKEFSLFWSDGRQRTTMKSFDSKSFDLFEIPCVKMLDITNEEKNDENETSDEDFSCEEADFMSLEEFLDAHRTNWYGDTKSLVVSLARPEKSLSDSEVDFHRTESMRENLASVCDSIEDDDIEELENDVEDEIFNSNEDDEESEEYSEAQKHSPGCVYSKKQDTQNFKAENIVFETDSDGGSNCSGQELSDFEETHAMDIEMNENLSDCTDEELISDAERTGAEDIVPPAIMKKSPVTAKKKVSMKQNSSEEEIIEDNSDIPVIQEAEYKKTPYLCSHLSTDDGKSTVEANNSFRQKKRRKKKNKLSTANC